jgi:hypothetical protein
MKWGTQIQNSLFVHFDIFISNYFLSLYVHVFTAFIVLYCCGVSVRLNGAACAAVSHSHSEKNENKIK